MRKKYHCLSHRTFTFPWLSLPGWSLSNNSFCPLSCSTQVHDSAWSGFPLSLFSLEFLLQMLVCISQCHGCQPLSNQEEVCVLRGAAWPQEIKTGEKWGSELTPFRSIITGHVTPVTSSPWDLLRTQQLPGTWVQPCLLPPEDDLLKLSVYSLATRMVDSEAVGVFGWRVGWMFWIEALPFHMFC